MIRRFADFLSLLNMFSDRRSRLRFLLVKARRRLPGAGAPRMLRIARLGDHSFWVRPHTHDVSTLRHAVLEAQYLPPPELAVERLSTVVELGANVGASVVALAFEHPEAELLAVEPDPGNFELLLRNIEPIGPRCRAVRAGVWPRDAELVVEGDSSFGFTVREADGNADPAARTVQGRTLDSLLDAAFGSRTIDYMHVCIEGSEPLVLGGEGRWHERVRSLRVELYPDDFGFTGSQAVELLERRGYRAWHTDGGELHGEPYAFGVRDEMAPAG